METLYKQDIPTNHRNIFAFEHDVHKKQKNFGCFSSGFMSNVLFLRRCPPVLHLLKWRIMRNEILFKLMSDDFRAENKRKWNAVKAGNVLYEYLGMSEEEIIKNLGYDIDITT